jgi:hypothetical protein
MGVHIRRGIKGINNYVFREEEKTQAFRKTADNNSIFGNFLGHTENETRSSSEILQYIYLRHHWAGKG